MNSFDAIFIGVRNPTIHHIGLDDYYFAARGALVDFRGPITIDKTVELGFNVKIYTASHHADWLIDGSPERRLVTYRPIVIGPKAWICSEAVLFNCTIGEGAIVGLGAVVMNQTVEPYTMVIGNPAKVVKVYDHECKKWVKLEEVNHGNSGSDCCGCCSQP